MNTTALLAAVAISIFIGWIFRRYLIDSMTNVHVASEATDYLQRDSINITTETDTYLFTNIAVIPKSAADDENNSDDNDSDDDSVDDSDDNSSDDSDSGSDGGDGD